MRFMALLLIVIAIVGGLFQYREKIKAEWVSWQNGPVSKVPERVVSAVEGHLSAGDDHVVFIGADGKLYGWGDNHKQQLGISGLNGAEYPQVLSESADWKYVHTGNSASYAISSNGQLWRRPFAFSRRQDGVDAIAAGERQLTAYQNIFWDQHWKKVEEHWNLAAGLTDSGQLWAWSEPVFSSVDAEEYHPKRVAIVTPGESRQWRDFCVGQGNLLAISTDGRLWRSPRPADSFRHVLYHERFDQTPPDQLELQLVPANARFSRVYCRDNARQVLVLDEQQQMWGYGGNDFGELGNGDGDRFKQTPDIPEGRIEKLGEQHWIMLAPLHSVSYGISRDGKLWAWGRNGDGELGLGNTDSQSKPVLVDDQHVWKAVAGGIGYGVGVTEQGQLFTWGRQYAVRGRAESVAGSQRLKPVAGEVKAGVH